MHMISIMLALMGMALKRIAKITRKTAQLFTLISLFSGSESFAQMNKTKEWNIGVYYGPLISTNTTGVSDVVPMYSFKLAKGISYYRPELFLQKGASDGSDGNTINYNVYGLTFKNYMNLEGINDLKLFILTGLQMSRYQTTTIGSAQGNGFHLGFGFEYFANKNLQLRNDYMLCNGPGRFLLVNIGLQYTFGDIKEE